MKIFEKLTEQFYEIFWISTIWNFFGHFVFLVKISAFEQKYKKKHYTGTQVNPGKIFCGLKKLSS